MSAVTALPRRYRLRNALVRLHLLPVYTRGERAYERGRVAASQHAQVSVQVAKAEERHALELSEALEKRGEEELTLLRQLAKAEPHHLHTLKKKAKKLVRSHERINRATRERKRQGRRR